jgi:hypothetical protein
MGDPRPAGDGIPALSLERAIKEICSRVEAAWRAGRRQRIEDFRSDLSVPRRPCEAPVTMRGAISPVPARGKSG